MVEWILYDYENRKVVARSNNAHGITVAARVGGVYITRGCLWKYVDGHHVATYEIRYNKIIK